ncbi:MAG: hypothetical protein ACTSXD_04695 [Candidatus Heimdallarchaeaceae archaeon]
MSLAHPFAQSIIQNCQKDSSWLLMLKWSKIDEVKKILEEKCDFETSVGSFILKYKYKGIDISFYKNGKLILTNVDNIENIIKELLG